MTSVKIPFTKPFNLAALSAFAEKQDAFCLLNSNSYAADYDLMIGIGARKTFTGNNFSRFNAGSGLMLGYLAYELKNEFENLFSLNHDELKFPLYHFFEPKCLLLAKDEVAEVKYNSEDETEAEKIIAEIRQTINDKQKKKPEMQDLKLKISARISKESYIDKVNAIKEHIRQGNIYEMNFCQEFYAGNAVIGPFSTYLKLNEISPMPFSCFYKHDDKYLLCASPERFLKKTASRIISQPIKGTIKRGTTSGEDALLRRKLLNDTKERSENIMIVDLVRNDLSKVAKRGTVKVDEFLGIHTFKQVHQMISTISCEVRSGFSFYDIIKAAFPMGSMTGAPKIKAMELIEKYETTKRGLFSGSVGYLDEKGDFDFNVVIRSILYNSTEKYLSFMVGSAITAKSDPEKEYEECLLKAKAILETLT